MQNLGLSKRCTSIAKRCAPANGLLIAWISSQAPPAVCPPPPCHLFSRVHPALAIAFLLFAGSQLSAAVRPNILWLTSEDHGPHMGAYGDTFATTPHVDALAEKGLTYTRAWSNAPVCAPARTTIISGLYPSSTGAHHMRSWVHAPAGKAAYPTWLREAGYYCTNNHKEDYNVDLGADLWDESSSEAHWQNRPDGQPFFAIFNSTVSHESQVRRRPHAAQHNPAQVTLPPYWPDDPAVRQDWAQYYDVVSQADAAAGKRLAELAAAGLEDETIVFYYADHGSGLPSHKRNPNNRGLHVPLVVYIPEKFAHLRPADYTPGGTSDRLVSFIDLAPTLLSLVGVEPPTWMQGNAFLGKHISDPPDYMFGFRARMDERSDNARSVTDGRYVYVRNFRPELPAGQHVEYQFETNTTRVWYQHFKDGKATPAQASFWLPTPAEELYDLVADPHEVNNLVIDPAHRAVKDRLASALFDHLEATRDLAFVPEAEMHRLAGNQSPFDWAREPGNYDYPAVARWADLMTRDTEVDEERLRAALASEDSLIRYWTLLGLKLRGPGIAVPLLPEIRERLADPAPDVAILSADLMARFGNRVDRTSALKYLRSRVAPDAPHYEMMAALTVINNLGQTADFILPALREFEGQNIDLISGRMRHDVRKLLNHTLRTVPNQIHP